MDLSLADSSSANASWSASSSLLNGRFFELEIDADPEVLWLAPTSLGNSRLGSSSSGHVFEPSVVGNPDVTWSASTPLDVRVSKPSRGVWSALVDGLGYAVLCGTSLEMEDDGSGRVWVVGLEVAAAML